MPKQNRGPYILAAGAAAQLLTGIPAAWGVFQQPVMQGYGFSRGQAMLGFAVLVAAYGVGCAVGGLLQDARGPRFAGLWGTALLAGGFFAAAFVPPANAALFLVVYSLPAGLGSAFLAPAVLACAQKWYQDKKGWATGVAGVAMGLSGAFFTVFVKGVGGAWGIRVCFAALGVVMLVVCGAGALILQDPPPKPQRGKPQPGPDFDYKQMLRTPQYKLCVAAVALSAPAVLLFSPEIFKIATERGLPECWGRRPVRRGGCCCPPSVTSWAASRFCTPCTWVLRRAAHGLPLRGSGGCWRPMRCLRFSTPAARPCSRPSTRICLVCPTPG